MRVTVKICGVNAPEAIDAAVRGGASHVGLNFYPPSPRYVTPGEAAAGVGSDSQYEPGFEPHFRPPDA